MKSTRTLPRTNYIRWPKHHRLCAPGVPGHALRACNRYTGVLMCMKSSCASYFLNLALTSANDHAVRVRCVLLELDRSSTHAQKGGSNANALPPNPSCTCRPCSPARQLPTGRPPTSPRAECCAVRQRAPDARSVRARRRSHEGEGLGGLETERAVAGCHSQRETPAGARTHRSVGALHLPKFAPTNMELNVHGMALTFRVPDWHGGPDWFRYDSVVFMILSCLRRRAHAHWLRVQHPRTLVRVCMICQLKQRSLCFPKKIRR